MKKRDLLRTISDAAQDAGLDWILARHGAKHDVYSLDGLIIPVPRHNEIAGNTARAILKQCDDKLGEDWWK